MNSSENSPVVISVETYTREWISKLRLALELCDRDQDVVIGSLIDTRLYIQNNPFSFYLGSGSEVEYELATSFSSEIHTLVTEGAIYDTPEKFVKGFERYDPEKNQILLWGAETAQLFDKELPEFRYHIMGWPRFDDYPHIYSALKHHFKKDSWHDVLIGLSHSGNNYGIYGTSTQEDRLEFEDFMTDIVAVMTELQDINFLLRPHPSGDRAKLEPYINQLPNVKISKGDDVGLEIVDASLVIHQNSTLGIESMLCKVPAISYYPKENYIAGGLGDAISKVVVGVGDLFNVCEYPDNIRMTSESSDLEEHIVNINPKENSTESLISYIMKNRKNDVLSSNQVKLEDILYSGIAKLFSSEITGTARKYNPLRRVRYSYNKFPTLDNLVLQGQIECLCDLFEISPPQFDRVESYENLIALRP